MAKHINVSELKGFDWWVQFRDPYDTIEKHASFLGVEIVCFTGTLLTLIHALRNGGRFRWLWLATLLHGITVECVSYFIPDIDNFWHAQGVVTFLGLRLPLYIALIYPYFIYTASVAVSHMRLPWWGEPFAVGVSVVLIDLPYDIMGIKSLWWTWHDTDPNIYDRHYWVPWTSYYFHATFACGFTLVFHGIRKLLDNQTEKWVSSSFSKELFTCVLTGLLGMPLGVLQFLPIYHPLHDTNKLHSEVCVALLFAVYVMIIWSADRSKSESKPTDRKNKYRSEILLHLILHYGFYIILVFISKPENNVVTGLHEPVGACQETVPVYTAFGHVLAKNKYLCLDHYDEAIFDFHCVKNLPKPGTDYYTICGTKFPNHAEYIAVICGVCTFGFFWFFQIMTQSYSLPRTTPKKVKQN